MFKEVFYEIRNIFQNPISAISIFLHPVYELSIFIIQPILG